MSNTYPIDYAEAVHEIKIEVELIGYQRSMFRLWVFKQLLRFAVWVGGFGGVEIKQEGDE